MAQNSPDIVWITLDSVRADHTTSHNYHRNTTPEISRIASSSRSAVFQHAYSHGIKTPVSVPSILTCLYPSQHKMVGQNDSEPIPSTLTTVPELLNKKKYTTICITENGWAGESKRLDKIFDHFMNISTAFPISVASKFPLLFLKYALNLYDHGPGLTYNTTEYGRLKSFFTKKIVKKKLEKLKKENEPIFCYIHLNDTHDPYIPPAKYMNEYTTEMDISGSKAVEFARCSHNNVDKTIANSVPFSDYEKEMLLSMYDSVISYVDQCVGTIFDYIQRVTVDTKTVITSDHGDLFGEKGILGHVYTIHKGLANVPLVTHGISDISAKENRPVQHNDIMKTILDIVGVDSSNLTGYNLKEKSRDVAITQHLDPSVDNNDKKDYYGIKQYNPDMDTSHLPRSLMTCAWTEQFKLEYTKETHSLHKLPDESEDVRHQYPKIYHNLLAYTKKWLQTVGKPLDVTFQGSTISDNVKRHLKNMGYKM